MSRELSAKLLLDPAVIDDPYPFYRQLREQAPVWRVPGTDLFVVSGYSLIEEAARRVEDFSSNMRGFFYRDENGLPAVLSFGGLSIEVLATADPPLHTLHKRAVFPEFVAKRMALLEDEIESVATACVKRLLAQGTGDFMALVANRIPITIISQLIGFRNSDLDVLLQTAFDSTELVGATAPLPRLHQLMARSTDIQTWIAEQLEIAKQEPGADILTSIGRGVESGAFDVRQGIVILQTLLGAGGESTTSLMGNAVRMLADDQRLQQELREHPESIPAFVEEALRLESPFRSMPRFVKHDTTLGGVDIPAGSSALLMFAAGNRDASMFEDPDAIVLGRPRRHLTFGSGIHTCVGNPLARLEGRVMLSVLLKRASSFALAPDDKPEWVNSLQVRRYERLPLSAAPA